MICHVTVRTAKLAETAEFYKWLLDIPVSRKINNPMAEIIFLGNDETKLELIRDDKAGKINAKGLTIGFATDDLEAKISMLNDRQIPHSEILSPMPGTRFVYFNDLNGCEIQLFEQGK